MTTLRTKRAVSALAALTLAVGGIGAIEIFSDAAAPAAHAATCPAPTTDITSKMTISDPELTDQSGTPKTSFTVGATVGFKVTWSTSSKVHAGEYFQYKVSTQSAKPVVPFNFDVKSSTGTVIGCGTWDQDGNVKVVFNDAAEGAASWDGWVITTAQLTLSTNEVGKTQPFKLTETKSVDVNIQPGIGVGVDFRKDGWLFNQYNRNRTLAWRITVPGGDTGLKNVSVVDNSEDTKWDFNCDDLEPLLKNNEANLKLVDSVANGYDGADVSGGAIRQNATISCSANKLEIKLPEVPANKFAIIVLYGHTPELVSGHYWNTATITADDMESRTVSAQDVVLGADAGAAARQVFSIAKKVDDSAAALTENPDFTFEVTLKGPGVDRTETVTVKKGQTYTYPDKLPIGTKVTIKEKNLPDASVLWDNATSGVFSEADGITLGADKKTATLTVNPEKDYTATVTNVTKPKPTPTPSTTTPTPSPTPSTTTPTPSPTPSTTTPTPSPTPSTTTPAPTPSTTTPVPTPSTTTPAPTPSTTTPTPEPTPSTTTPEPSPSTTTSVPPAPTESTPPSTPSEQPKKPKNPKSSLAKTGADSGILLGLGMAALIAGGAAVATRRKMG
ncbi:Ig-like domain-containing protein [uncultured Actinomyces sp.]|uniref:Ig-like domain-containing protein n=1 Tax=uncultured Actinomyces sp. TaxID=249061 RepID=UPI0028EE0A30|nr:Ig-like domain-containing protein [uncultured Actinomyces sp.]